MSLVRFMATADIVLECNMSRDVFSTVAERVTHCKLCNGDSILVGVVDFSKGGADTLAGHKVNPYVGIPIYYYSCQACGFTFTRALDNFTHQDFSEKIYNQDYVLNDPDYLSLRPKTQASIIHSFITARIKRCQDTRLWVWPWNS